MASAALQAALGAVRASAKKKGKVAPKKVAKKAPVKRPVQQRQQRVVKAAPKVKQKAVKKQAPKGRPQQQQGSGIPEVPDFTDMVQPVPTYDDISGSVPSWQDFLDQTLSNWQPSHSISTRTSGGGGGGSFATPGTPGNPAASAQPMDDLSAVSANLAAALGGSANAGAGDISAMTPAIADELKNRVDASNQSAASAAIAGSSGGGGGGGGGSTTVTEKWGAMPNPYTAAATMQKMAQAEAIFGPKLMAQYLKNQGYSIKNMKDYQSAWIDQAMFGPEYAYAVGKVGNINARTRATNVATAITMGLAGPKIQKSKLDVIKRGVDIQSSRQNMRIRNVKLKYDIRSKNDIHALRAMDVQLKALGITGRELSNQAKAAQLKENGKNGGYTKSEKRQIAKDSASMAEDAWKVENPDWPGIGPGRYKPMDYKLAVKKQLSAKIPLSVAKKSLNVYYRPGQHGRPKGKSMKNKTKH